MERGHKLSTSGEREHYYSYNTHQSNNKEISQTALINKFDDVGDIDKFLERHELK